MDPLDAVVGHGTLIAGRYRLGQRDTCDLPDAEAWNAHDQILDRPVRATILGGPRARAAVDAARRASLVTDPRLVRILDVGEHAGSWYVVTEPVTGPSLAELTARGPLSAAQARTVVGEAAAALEVARRRGVHHLALRPSAVHRTPSGEVLVTGLGLDAVLLGATVGDARATSRADAVALVGLLYLALTGRWPGGDAAGVPAAPVVQGLPVPPGELTPGVPNDLDTLCSVTLGPHDDGPHSPSELVRELEPWIPLAQSDADSLGGTAEDGGVGGAGADGGVGGPGVDGGASDGDPTEIAAGGSAVPAAADAAPGPASTDPTPSGEVRRASVRTRFAGTTSPGATRPGTPPPAEPDAPTRQLTPPTGTPAPAVVPPRHPPASTRPASSDRPGSTDATPPTGVPVAPGAAPRARQSSGPGSGAVRTPPQGSRTPPPAAPVTPLWSHVSDSGRGAGPGGAGTSLFGGVRDDGPPPPGAPRPPVGGAGRGSRRIDPTWLVIAVVVLAVVVGLAVAAVTLLRPVPGGSRNPDPSPGSVRPSASATATPRASATPSAAAPVIASASSVDPPPGGDNNEHPELVDRAIDGDPATSWYSRTYVNPSFGMKPGIGFAITLTGEATVSEVTLQVNGSGGRVEVRATDPSNPTAGATLAEGPLSPTTVLRFAKRTTTSDIVLWFPELPQTPDGKNRIEIYEITVS